MIQVKKMQKPGGKQKLKSETALQKKNYALLSNSEPETKTVECTASGNRLYRFRTVSRKELEQLRVPSYSYLL
jgi:hypothetical protein